MEDGRAWLICAFLMCCWCSVSVLSQAPTCTVNFELDDETEDQKYLYFMADLENLTFSLADECPNPEVINNLVWQYRFTVYKNYEDEIQNCRCSRTQEALEICIEVVWGMIKIDVVAKRAEYYGFCGEDYKSLSLDRYTDQEIFI